MNPRRHLLSFLRPDVLCIVGFLSVIGLGTGGMAISQEKESAEFKLAVGLLNDGMYDLAVEQFKNYIDAYPNTSQGVEARFYLGQALLRLKRFEEARVIFQNFALSYTDHPRAPEAWMNVGKAFASLDNAREAASAFERVRVFHPKSAIVPDALVRAAQFHRVLGDHGSAKRALLTIIKDFPTSKALFRARLLLSAVYFDEGQLDLAEREVRKVSESNAPSEVKAEALLSLGRLNAAAALFDDASTAFRSVLTTTRGTPSAIEAALELGLLEIGAKRYAPAIEEFNKVVESASASDSLKERALFEVGKAYYALQEYLIARRTFERILSDFPEGVLTTQTTLKAGRAALRSGDPQSALDYATRLLSLPSSDGKRQALIIAADAARQLNRHADAARFYRQYVDEFSGDTHAPVVLLKLADLYNEQMEDCARALRVYDEIADRHPQSNSAVEALFKAARCRERMGDYAEAVRIHRSITGRYSASKRAGEAERSAAFISDHRSRNRDAALEKLARLVGDLAAKSSVAEVAYRLGEVYFVDLKDYEAAARQFTTAIEGGLDPSMLAEASFLRARALQLLSVTDTAVSAQAVRAYMDFLTQHQTGSRADDASYFLLELESRNGSVEDRLARFNEFLSLNPESRYLDRVLIELGINQASQGNDAPALQVLNRLIGEYPQSSSLNQALFLRGTILARMGKSDSAAADWQRVIQSRQKSAHTVSALSRLARMEHSRGNLTGAIRHWEQIANEFAYTEAADTAARLLAEAEINAGNADEGIAYFQNRFETQTTSPLEAPADYGLLVKIAAGYEKKGNRQRAQSYYTRFLLHDRQRAEASTAFYALGSIARAQGRPDLASAYFKQAAARAGTTAPSKEIADLLFQSEQYVEAARQYVQLVQSGDESVDRAECQSKAIVAMLRTDNLVDAQRLTGEYDRWFGKANKEHLAEFEYEKGLLHYRKQDYTGAKKSFEKVVDDYGSTRLGPWAHFYIGKVAEVTGRREDAAKKYESLLSKHPSSDVIPRVLLSLGNMHFNVERYEQSIQLYRQIAAAPGKAGDILPYALNNLIEAYESTKLYDEALKTSREFIERYPNDESLVDKKIKIGTLYTRLGFYDQAILQFQNLLGESGGDIEAEVRYSIGEAYYEKGDYQQAILEFLKVPYLVQKQGRVDWTATSLYMAGQAYEKMSKFEEAIGLYQQIIDRPGIDATFKGMAKKEIDRVKAILGKGSK